MNQARYLGLALMEFADDYGSLPGPHTAEEVRKRTGTRIALSGNSANAIFRQLIAAGLLKDAPVGFAYVMDGDRALPTQRNDLILAAAPFPDASGRFDLVPFQSKGIAIHADGAIRMCNLERGSGRLLLGNGKTLLDTGTGTIWGTDLHPVLRLPERP